MICYYFFSSVFLSFSLFHSRLNFSDRILWLSVLCKNMLPQIKITAKIFPATIYSRGNTAVFSNLNSLHKNTVLRNRVCSITTGLFFQKQILTHTIARTQWKWKYYQCWVLGTFWNRKKSQSVLIAKISSRKTQKIANP